jgi:hypothetical protein
MISQRGRKALDIRHSKQNRAGVLSKPAGEGKAAYASVGFEIAK